MSQVQLGLNGALRVTGEPTTSLSRAYGSFLNTLLGTEDGAGDHLAMPSYIQPTRSGDHALLGRNKCSSCGRRRY